MVKKRQYALQESASGKDINTDVPLYHGLRRGMQINMSMIFFENRLVVGVRDTQKEVTIRWYAALSILDLANRFLISFLLT